MGVVFLSILMVMVMMMIVNFLDIKKKEMRRIHQQQQVLSDERVQLNFQNHSFLCVCLFVFKRENLSNSEMMNPTKGREEMSKKHQND